MILPPPTAEKPKLDERAQRRAAENRRVALHGLPFNVSIRGTSRKGKTVFLLRNYTVPAMKARDRLTAVIDPARQYGIEAAQWAIFLGYRPEDVIIDDLTDLEHVLPIEILGISEDPRPAFFEAECRDMREQLIGILSISSGTDVQQFVTIKENINLVGMVYQYQKVRRPQWMIPFALRPWTREFQQLFDGIDESRPDGKVAKGKMKLIADLYRQSKPEFHRFVGPTLRRLEELFEDPAIRVRLLHEPYDIESLIERRGVYIMLGGESGRIGPTALNFLMRDFGLRLPRIARRRFAAGLMTPMDIHVDEWGGNRLVHKPEVVNLSQTLKMGCCFRYSTQNDDTGDPLLNDDFQQNCAVQVTFHCSSTEVAERAAGSMVSRFDPYRVKRVKERKRTVIEGYEEVATESHRYDEHGHKQGKGTGTSRVPKHKEVTDTEDEHMAIAEQRTELVGTIKTLKPGWFLEVRDGVVSGPDYEPMLKNPWTYPAYAQEQYECQYRRLIDLGILKSVSGVDWPSSEDDTPPTAPAKKPRPPLPPDGAGRSPKAGPGGSTGRSSTSTSRNSR